MANHFYDDVKGAICQQAPDALDTTITGSRPVPRTDRPKRRVGHECEFIERPPKQFQSECSICLLILREPHLISCCGHSFCEACIGRIREDGKSCPLCNKPGYTTLPNQGLQRALNEFDVRCSHRELGCEWMDKLGNFDGHLNADPQPDCQLMGCQFVMVKCIHCKTSVRRLAIAVHQNELCPKRLYTCEYCKEYESTFEDVASQHYAECNRFLLPCPNKCESGIERQDLEHHIQEDCPLTIVDCSLHYAGCDVRLPRKDLESHMKEDASSHVALLAAENQRMAKQLLEKDEQIQENVQQLTKENSDIRTCIDELRGELAQHQQLLAKNKQIQDNVQQLTKEKADLRSYIDELRGEISRHRQHTTQELAWRVNALRLELTDQHQKATEVLMGEVNALQLSPRVAQSIKTCSTPDGSMLPVQGRAKPSMEPKACRPIKQSDFSAMTPSTYHHTTSTMASHQASSMAPTTMKIHDRPPQIDPFPTLAGTGPSTLSTQDHNIIRPGALFTRPQLPSPQLGGYRSPQHQLSGYLSPQHQLSGYWSPQHQLPGSTHPLHQPAGHHQPSGYRHPKHY